MAGPAGIRTSALNTTNFGPECAHIFRNRQSALDDALRASIKSNAALKAIYSPSHNVGVSRSGDYAAKVGYEDKNVRPDIDFKLMFSRSKSDVGLNLLTYKTGSNRTTTWITEYLIKRPEDVGLIEKYMPVAKLNQKAIAAEYDRIGDAGILRGFVWGDQAGCWQHACCLMSEEQIILECVDHPDWVHRLLRALLERKLRFIAESLMGATFDLIETGGGAGGGRMFYEAEHSYQRNSEKRVIEAVEKGAEVLATSCPFCVMTLEDPATEKGLPVKELSEIVIEAL